MPAPGEDVDLMAIMASSIHDMKNSLCILIGGLERMAATSALRGTQEHEDVVHMMYETKRINSNLMQMLTLYKLGQHLYPFDPLPQSVEDFLLAVAAQN